MGIAEVVKKWIFEKALKKGVVSAVKLLVAWCVAQGITIVATVGGIAIDTTDIGIMTVAINSALTMLRNWLKIKFPKQCGWL